MMTTSESTALRTPLDRAAARGQLRSAFTLTELLWSAGIMGILALGISSALVLSSKALPDRAHPANAAIHGYSAADELANDLACAQTFPTRTATKVELTVADRNGDGSPELICYEWAGKGSPLMRTLNGGKPQIAVADVHQFALSFNVRSATTSQNTTTDADSGEVLLSSFTGWALLPTTQYYQVSTSSWCGEYAPLSIPSNARDVRITRVRLKVRSGTAVNGAISVSLHRPVLAADIVPKTQFIGSPAALLASAFSATPTWIDFSFSDAMLNPSDQSVIIEVRGTATDAARVEYLYSLLAPADGTMMGWTTNSGSSWQPTRGLIRYQDILFYLYGSYTTTATQQTALTRYFISSVGLTLQVGDDAAAALNTAVRVFSEPEVQGP